MIEAQTVDALSTIKLLVSIEALYALLALIHVFLDNASYRHAKIVREWLAQPGRRIKLRFIPAYRPRLNPIERLWGACTETSRMTNLCDMRPIRQRDARFPAWKSSLKLGGPMRFGHRQFPRHIAQGFSGCRVNRV
jgi:transposase